MAAAMSPLAPYASDPAASRGRHHPEPTDAVRGPRDAFQRDRDRIAHVYLHAARALRPDLVE